MTDCPAVVHTQSRTRCAREKCAYACVHAGVLSTKGGGLRGGVRGEGVRGRGVQGRGGGRSSERGLVGFKGREGERGRGRDGGREGLGRGGGERGSKGREGKWRAVARRAVLSAQGVRSVQSTVLCQSVLCVFVRGALRYVPVRQKAHASQP